MMFGATGTGKTVAARQLLRAWRPARLVVVDPMRQLDALGPAAPTLEAALGAMRAPSFAVRWFPSSTRAIAERELSVLARACVHAGDCTLFVDELADFVRPGWAPEGWTRIVRQGRAARVRVIAASQRPAHIDKEVLGNATVIRTGRLNTAADVRTLAQLLDVDPDEIRRLAPLEWIERDMGGAGETRRGRISF